MSSLLDEIASAIDAWWDSNESPTDFHDGVEYIASLELAEVIVPIVKEAQANALDAWAANMETLSGGRRNIDLVKGLRLAAGNAKWHAEKIRGEVDEQL